jgi:hypothetical protein
VFTAILRALDLEQGMGIRRHFDCLVKFITGGLPMVWKALQDDVGGIDLLRLKSLKGIVDLGAHSHTILPITDTSRLLKGVNGAMDHHRRLTLLDCPQDVLQRCRINLINTNVVDDDVVVFGKLRVGQTVEVVSDLEVDLDLVIDVRNQ